MVGCVGPPGETLWFVRVCVLTSSSSPAGVYGDVMRVKILFNKKENALVQMSDGTQAQLGSYTRSPHSEQQRSSLGSPAVSQNPLSLCH